MRRCLALTAAVFVTLLVVPNASAQEEQLSYSIKEARAYAVKGSIPKEAIELIPKCDPAADPDGYACTDHNHKPNCPKSIEIGEKGKVPVPKPPKGVEPTAGRAGEGVGENPPPQSSAIRANRFMSLAKLSHLFGVKESGGVSSQLYVDNSGRSEPEAHTISDGFSSSIRDWEERCHWNDGSSGDEEGYEHYLSRSGESPNTYHLAECVGRQCQLGAGINVERARSIIQLVEKNGKAIGTLSSSVDGLRLGEGGEITIDSIETYVRFETDGTAPGLKWEVASAVSDAKIAGQPVPLPLGDRFEGSGLSFGVTEPYVEAPDDGGTLTIVAPGLHVGSEQQAALLGGVELYMSMGEDARSTFVPDGTDPASDDAGSDVGGSGFDTGSGIGDLGGGTADLGGSGTGVEAGEETLAAGEPGELLIFEKATGVGAVAVIIALGGFCWFLLLSRWLQRYAWGAKLTRFQPFRFFDWMYRAFVKS
jgi:hypothetical protein